MPEEFSMINLIYANLLIIWNELNLADEVDSIFEYIIL